MHWHRIEQFIREMDSAKRLEIVERFFPGHFADEIPQRLRLPSLQNRERFDDSITQRRKKFRRLLPGRRENIPGKISMMRSLFDNNEVIRPPEDFPHLG
jgi:hypothetical protein